MDVLSAIVIPDDEESILERGHSRPPRAPRPYYSYQQWKDTIDDAATSDDAGVTVSATRKRKRQQTEDSDDDVMRSTAPRHTKSIASILKDAQKTLEDKLRRQQRTLIDSYRTTGKLQEELRQEKERHQKTKEQQTKKRALVCTICYGQPDHWVTLLCGHLFCKRCDDRWRNLDKTCPTCRRPITGHVDCTPYAG